MKAGQYAIWFDNEIIRGYRRNSRFFTKEEAWDALVWTTIYNLRYVEPEALPKDIEIELEKMLKKRIIRIIKVKESVSIVK